MAPLAILLVKGGPNDGARIDLPMARTNVGSSNKNHVVVDLPSVSQVHAYVQGDMDGHWITDLDSANGTYVNGERVVADRHRLRAFDRITLGAEDAAIHLVFLDSRETIYLPRSQLPTGL